jgi:hypothetical protein
MIILYEEEEPQLPAYHTIDIEVPINQSPARMLINNITNDSINDLTNDSTSALVSPYSVTDDVPEIPPTIANVGEDTTAPLPDPDVITAPVVNPQQPSGGDDVTVVPDTPSILPISPFPSPIPDILRPSQPGCHRPHRFRNRLGKAAKKVRKVNLSTVVTVGARLADVATCAFQIASSIS